MSTLLNDFGSNAVGNSSIPAAGARTANLAGQWVDLLQGDGLCNVLVAPGVITDGNFTITIQQSTDASNGTAATIVPLSALPTISNTTVANSTIPKLFATNFNRDYRYVRANVTAADTSTGGCLSVIIFEQRKFVAPNQ